MSGKAASSDQAEGTDAGDGSAAGTPEKKAETGKDAKAKKIVNMEGKVDSWNSGWFCNFPLLSSLWRFLSICKAPINAEMNQGLVASGS